VINHDFFYIFQYQKPPEVYGLEKKIFQELKKIKPLKEGDVECNPSWGHLCKL
jgi:hypothetical protein